MSSTHADTDSPRADSEVGGHAGPGSEPLEQRSHVELDPNSSGISVRQTLIEVSRGQLTPEQRVCPDCRAEHRGLLFKGPKSKAGRRWLPLAGPAREALLAHRQQQLRDRELFGPDYSEHQLVFSNLDGSPLRPGAVTTAFEARIKECGVPVIRLHDTRHGACSLMLAGGVPIEIVQMIMGHSSPDVTRKVYAHVMRQATTDQVNVATDLLTRHRRGPVGNPVELDSSAAGRTG